MRERVPLPARDQRAVDEEGWPPCDRERDRQRAPEEQVAETRVHCSRPEEENCVVDDLHRRDGERVGHERDPERGAERCPRAEQRE